MNIRGWQIGLTVCYDLRFPALYQRLSESPHSVDLILVPAAFTVPTGEAGHWHTLLKARAIENQVYIIAAAQVGKHHITMEKSRISYGHSLMINPWGITIADLSPVTAESIIINDDLVTHKQQQRGQVQIAILSKQTLLETKEKLPIHVSIFFLFIYIYIYFHTNLYITITIYFYL